jgi:hypothetical protein
MLLRALKDACDPWITRAQNACPRHSRQLSILAHQLAHTLEGLLISVPRNDVLLIVVVGLQLLQVLPNTVPALGPNGLALVHERRKVEVVSFNRVLHPFSLPCVGEVGSRDGATFHIERE